MSDIDNDKLGALVGKDARRPGRRVQRADGPHRLPARPLRCAASPTAPRPRPSSPARTGLAERYVREWAFAQAANGYIAFDAEQERFSLTPEQAMVFAVKDSPVYLDGAFDLGGGDGRGPEPRSKRPSAPGRASLGAKARGCLFCAVGAFFRPGYVNSIVQAWLPALDGVLPQLQAGAKVADVGCGVGFSTLLMAKAFPAELVRRLRLPRALDRAGQRACEGAWSRRSRAFRDRRRQGYRRPRLRPRHHVRLPARHGRPARLRDAYADAAEADGAWMIVEPIAGRPARRQYRQPGQPALLQRLDDDLRADLARAGGRRGSRRPGGRGEADRGAEECAASAACDAPPRARSTWCSKPACDWGRVPGPDERPGGRRDWGPVAAAVTRAARRRRICPGGCECPPPRL